MTSKDGKVKKKKKVHTEFAWCIKSPPRCPQTVCAVSSLGRRRHTVVRISMMTICSPMHGQCSTHYNEIVCSVSPRSNSIATWQHVCVAAHSLAREETSTSYLSVTQRHSSSTGGWPPRDFRWSTRLAMADTLDLKGIT